MSDPSPSYPSDRALWSVLVLVLLGLAGILGADLYAEYRHDHARERASIEKVAAMVELNLSRRLQTTSDVLDSIRDELPWLLSQQIEHHDAELLNRRLQALVVAQTGVRSLLVVNAAGRLIASSRPELVGQDVSQGERYQIISRGLDPALLYVTAPAISPLKTYVMSVGPGAARPSRQVRWLCAGHPRSGLFLGAARLGALRAGHEQCADPPGWPGRVPGA